MRHLLENADDALKQADRKLAAGDLKEARHQYLRAAECIYRAAGKSNGELKESRLAAAKRIQDLVGTLDDRLQDEPHQSASCGSNDKVSGDNRQRVHTSDEESQDHQWQRTNKTGVSFKDVAGLEAVKREVQMNFIHPAKFPEDAKHFGIALGGGLLLYGPPGTGKTLIARAIAGEVDAALYVVSAADIMSKWVGEAEQRVKALFADAHRQPRSIIFIDEIESLLPKRKQNGSTVMARVIPQFLSELDGFDRPDSQLLFIGATNEPWSLDPAVLRPGRFDTVIYVPLPDTMARKRMFEIYLEDLSISEAVDINELAELTDGFSGADIRRICSTVGRAPFEEKIFGSDERQIERMDFVRTISEFFASVSPKQIREYELFRN